MLENFTYPYEPAKEEENELDGGSVREIHAIDYNNV